MSLKRTNVRQSLSQLVKSINAKTKSAQNTDERLTPDLADLTGKVVDMTPEEAQAELNRQLALLAKYKE